MRGSAAYVRWVAPAALASLLALSGCGNDESERQGADDEAGTYTVDVITASFPRRQQLSTRQTLRMTVRNAGTETIPGLAVSLEGLDMLSEQPGIADPRSPVWIVDEAPRAGVTAYVGTWSLGELAPNDEQEYVWRMTPVVAGRHTVRWRVAGNLTGSAKAQLADGGVPEGTFNVRVRAVPRPTRVNPQTGQIVRPVD
jgi:hypothetical protein